MIDEASSARGERNRKRGRSRELDVLHHFRDQGWVAYRLAWGNADVMACRLDPGDEPESQRIRLLLVQVKCTGSGPFDHFRPLDRQRLLDECAACGAQPVLAYWPPYGTLQLLDESKWPRRAQLEAMA